MALLFGLLFMQVLDCRAEDPSHLLFVGTQTIRGSGGIYSTHLDPATGALKTTIVAAEAFDSWFLALSPDKRFLYSVSESPGLAVGYAVEGDSGRLRALHPTPAPGAVGPCHLAVDASGRTLLVANYDGGALSISPLGADGSIGTPSIIRNFGRSVDPVRQLASHVHAVILSPDNRFVIVCDFGLDKIFTYRLDAASATLVPASPAYVAAAPHSGPRHMVFGADGLHAYVINEMACTVVAYDFDPLGGSLVPRQTISTLPADFAGQSTCAEIRMHPNGRFLYGSNRGHDSIAVYSIEPNTGFLSLVEIVPCAGKTPRNFTLSPDGKWLVCANQDSDSLAVFRVDDASGRLTLNGPVTKVPAPVCVVFYN
jgi:6-phosphogluconolactonase